MSTHSSILAWKISGPEEPGGLQSMESQRVRHDLATEHIRMHCVSLNCTVEQFDLMHIMK